MPALPSLSSYTANSFTAFFSSSVAGEPPVFASPITSEGISSVPLVNDFDGARVMRAVAKRRTHETCETVLPKRSPVEVQIGHRTVMHLHSEPDRTGFLNEHRASAVWMEMLGATRAKDGCPADVRPGEVASDIAARMSCLGIGVAELRGADAQASSSGDANQASGTRDISEFATVEALSLPSVYIRAPGFEPGTMSALLYDLGWRALAPSWRNLMPSVDEALWAPDPNTELFCAVGRAVLPHLATHLPGNVADGVCARIVSFHLHAGGLTDCLANVTQTVERTSPEGQPKTVAAIEFTDFLRECAGTDWRDLLARPEGEDALTRRREACMSSTTLSPTTVTSADDFVPGEDDLSTMTPLRRA